MRNSFSRRDALRASGLVAVTSLSGCFLDNQETAPGHIYAENSSGEEQRLAIVVGEQSEGTLDFEIQALYRIPSEHALQFEEVLEPNLTHVIRIELPGSPPQDRVTGTIDQCPESQGGERVVTLDVQPDGLGIIPRDCEESYTQRELEYVAASEYQIRSLDRTLTTTSGSGEE